jgi:malonyl-CoA O-methyltransferase
MRTSHALANRAAYDIWAASYPPVPHNPLMRAEHHAMQELWPPPDQVKGASALDLACGTGRYSKVLCDGGARRVVSLDYSAGMLERMQGSGRVRGDMMFLPFTSSAFDFVVSGLAVGHAPSLEGWVREVARVLVPGGVMLYSDFHPEAAAAGMTRSFTDTRNRQHTLEHRRHAVEDHERAARGACLEIEATREVRVGLELNEGFAGAETFYRRWHGLPVVLVLRMRKVTNA